MAKTEELEIESIEHDIEKEIDSYQDTVWGLLAFAHEMLWDDAKRRAGDDSRFHFGRRMTTSEDNRITPNEEVTPDLVVQPVNDYGVSAEAKIGYTPKGDVNGTAYKQLQKYDDELIGWFTDDELVKTHDVAFLVHETRRVEVDDDIASRIEDGSIRFHRNFAVVSFARMPQIEEQIWLQRGYGQLSDVEKNDKLRRGVPVKCEFLAAKTDTDIILYDDPPPLPLLMNILWNDVFQSMVDIGAYVEHRAAKDLKLTVNPGDIAQKISNQMFPFWSAEDERRPAIPKPTWVRNALEAFVSMGWAIRSEEGSYEVELKERRRPYAQFLRHEAKQRQKKNEQHVHDAEQMSLFAEQIQNGTYKSEERSQ